jgi:pimeloyl-ACP methyl ester carboxylesterase
MAAHSEGIELPPPTGPYAVGRVAYHWIDSSRHESYSADQSARRELMVEVWYPAETPPSAQTAPYLPDFATMARVDGDLKRVLGAAYSEVESGRLRTHTVEGAALSQAEKRYPLLVFSHGFDEQALNYTAMLEDLASHGYVIAAVEHPYDAGCVIFPDGRAIGFAQEKWDEAIKKPDGAVAYQSAQIPIRAADIRFTISQMICYAEKPELGALFAGRLDLRKIGVFGHSLGGVAAARACQLDRRIRAGMNQDADLYGYPYIVYSRGDTIRQPFCFFATDHSIYISDHIPPPTDEELAKQKLSRDRYNAMVHAYQHNQDNALAAMPAGSYRICLEGPGSNHRSFMDTNLLAIGNSPAAAKHRLNLQIVREYTLAFFDKYLRGKKDTILERSTNHTPEPDVRIDRFGKAAE